jgi:hypothetical protein
MKKNQFLLVILFLIGSTALFSQSLKKIPLSTSGCSLYTYCEMKFEISKSVDSSKVFMGECNMGEVNYGVIAVQLLNQPENLLMAEDLLIAYLDHLKTSFSIVKAAGYGKGHTLNNDLNTRGILDYWEDTEKNNWKVKGWTNGKIIGVMYAYSLKEIPESKVNVFLDGLRMGN